MKRRLFLACMLSSPALSRAAAPFSPDRDGYGRQKDHDHQDNHDADRVGHGKGHARYFRPEDREMLGRYYPVQSLPPGLKRKYSRTGAIPPGWQNRMRPLPHALVERLPPPPPNCDTGYVDGYAVVYNRKTRVILDALDLIGAVMGR